MTCHPSAGAMQRSSWAGQHRTQGRTMWMQSRAVSMPSLDRCLRVLSLPSHVVIASSGPPFSCYKTCQEAHQEGAGARSVGMQSSISHSQTVSTCVSGVASSSNSASSHLELPQEEEPECRMPAQVVGAAASGVASFAVDASGCVWSWGTSKRGQLGQGTGITHLAQPQRLPRLEGIVSVACGWGHALALQGNLLRRKA